MRKTIFILVAVLPVLAFMAGCGGGYAEPQNAQYSPQDDYVDWGAVGDTWSGAFQPFNDFAHSTQHTMRDQQRTLRQMERDDKDTLRIINGAQRQQRP
jgi:hypothetical protein